MHNHFIGILYKWEETDIVTLEQLKEEIEQIKKINRYYRKNNKSEYCYKYENLKDFLDNRKHDYFKRFSYCPVCGEKINYRKIIEESKEHEN